MGNKKRNKQSTSDYESTDHCKCNDNLKKCMDDMKDEIKALREIITKLVERDQFPCQPNSWSQVVATIPKKNPIANNTIEEEMSNCTKLLSNEPSETIVEKLKKSKTHVEGSRIISKGKTTSIEVPNEKLDKVKSSLNKGKITYKEIKKREPTAIIPNIPNWMSAEAIKTSLLSDNPSIFTDENDILNIYVFPARSNALNQRVSLRLSSKSFSKLAENNMWLRLDSILNVCAHPDLKPTRCLHCGQFGHSTKICEQITELPTCFHCAGQHSLEIGNRNCRKTRKCAACSKSNTLQAQSSSHHTFDGNCPLLQLHTKRNIDNTKFTPACYNIIQEQFQHMTQSKYHHAN